MSDEQKRDAERALFRPSVRREVNDELEFHIAMRVRELVAAGMDEATARAEARKRFGDMGRVAAECQRLGQERERETRRAEYLSELVQDIRYGARQLRRAPGFALVAILTLALGIGATTSIFSVVRGVLLRAMPYPDADRVVVPQSRNLEDGSEWSLTYADYQDWRRAHVFAHVAVFQEVNFNIAGDGPAERIPSAQVSDEFFDVLGVTPVLGRVLRPDEFALGTPPRAVISYGLWQRRYGGARDVVGRIMHVTGVPVEIVGVLPRGTEYPAGAEMWLPSRRSPRSAVDDARRDNFVWNGVARLAPGRTLQDTRNRLAALAAIVAREEPAIRSKVTVTAVPLNEYVVGQTTTRTLWVFLAAVGLVLLVACVNVANLLMARSAARGRELAVRASVGASRARLARQLLTESLVLALVGGAAGVALAYGGVRALVAFAPPGLPRVEEIALDPVVLAFALGVSVASALIFGLVPALRAARRGQAATLHESDRRSTGGVRGRRARDLLVAAELALSLVLLVGAGLLVRSFDRLRATDPGFRTDHLLTFSLSLQGQRYNSDAAVVTTFATLRERLRAMPGVSDAATASTLPLGGGGFYLGRVFLPEGRPEPPAGEDVAAEWVVSSPDFFRTLNIPLVRGRAFTARDDSASTPVMIVNREFAARMFGREDPLGKRVRSWRDENVYRKIVGVVDNVRYFAAGDSIRPVMYVPHAQSAWGSEVIAVRTTVPPASLASQVRRLVSDIDPTLAVADVRTMGEIFDTSVASSRFAASLLALFAAIALALAVVGTYGVLSYAVSQRTREIGIRMALGARRAAVVRMILREAALVIVVGLGAGVIAALGATRLMRALLYEVSATDPAVYVAVAAALTAAALAASLVPARRASSLDPVTAIRLDG
ncbi:MAG TPA: ABC transporter permease [Gemmatimonadaceae bacterium]|nr:ABC transporter permease [Gemmatimonadaceae bacterium]